MKNIFIVFLLYIGFSNFCYAQVTADMYEKIVGEKLSLKAELDSYKKLLATANDKIREDSIKYITQIKLCESKIDSKSSEINKELDKLKGLETKNGELNAAVAECTMAKSGLEKQIIIKDGEIAKLNEELKSSKTLKSQNESLEAKNLAQANEIKNKETEIVSLKKQIDENKTLIDKNTALAKTNADLLKTNAELTTKNTKLLSDGVGKEEEIKKLNGEIEKCKTLTNKNVELEKANKDLTTKTDVQAKEITQKIVEIASLNTKITDLNLQITSLKTDKSSLQAQNGEQVTVIKNKEGEIAKLKTDIESVTKKFEKLEVDSKPMLTENQNLKTSLSEHLKFSVAYLVESKDYSSTKTQELLNKCETTQKTYSGSEVAGLLAQLKQYQQICAAIDKAKVVLAVVYNKTTCAEAVKGFENIGTTTEKQKKDLNYYKNLLANYCNISNNAHKQINNAKVFLPDNPNKTAGFLREYLQNSEIFGYDFLITEINKVIANVDYGSKIQKTDCK